MDGEDGRHDKARASPRIAPPHGKPAMPRPSGRAADQLRPVTLETKVNRYAEGSCLIGYGMLPRATHTRGRREAAVGKPSGRTQEIQRLIGRSLRAVVDLRALGERQIQIDCDVVQADGGTRTASVTGAWVALRLATAHLLAEGVLKADPILDQVAAISCGVHGGAPVLDLDYEEDSAADTDANFVLTGGGDIVEIQATGEKRGFTRGEFDQLFDLARTGCADLFERQRAAVPG